MAMNSLSVLGGNFATRAYADTVSGPQLISTTSLTGASVTLTSIPQTFRHLQVIVRNFLPATDDTNMQLRINADATASRHYSATVGLNSNASFTTTAWQQSIFGNDNAVSQSFTMWTIYDYANTTTWKTGEGFIVWNNATTATNLNIAKLMHAYNQTAAVSSLQLLMNSGNFTSGSVLLYGIR